MNTINSTPTQDALARYRHNRDKKRSERPAPGAVDALVTLAEELDSLAKSRATGKRVGLILGLVAGAARRAALRLLESSNG